jgi:rhodanese-related sulfurtransferase
MIATVTRQELQAMLREGAVVLLEALPAMYFDKEHLPGAKNLPLDDIETLAPVLVPVHTTPVVTYCTCVN